MCVLQTIFLAALCLTGLEISYGLEDEVHHTAHKGHSHKYSTKHTPRNDSALRFEPEPYSKKLELNSSGKIHCKVAGGVAPTVQWFLNEDEPLPEGITSTNGTLLVSAAAHRHAGRYTCRATDGGNRTIAANVTIDVVVSPRVIWPSGDTLHTRAGAAAILNCRAAGNPAPRTTWDRNLAMMHTKDAVAVEGSANESTARIVVFNNGTLFIRNASVNDSDRYGCTAGSAAGLARGELLLVVVPEGEALPESSGVAGKAVIVSIAVAGAYMALVLALVVYCRRRRLQRRRRGEKMELEMAEGREKLVEDGEAKGEDDKKVANGAPVHNGRLMPHDNKESGADNSEVSAVSRASKKSGQLDHLNIPRSMLLEPITLGRGEFGDVLLAKLDMSQVRKLRNKDDAECEPKLRPVLVKELTTKDETQLCEFRRQLDLFSRARHPHIARLLGLSRDNTHCMLLLHADWGDLKKFLLSGSAPLPTAHEALLAAQLAAAALAVAHLRLTHRDIAARNCLITSQLHLKLSCVALSRGPDSKDYYKMHDQVIPLRWLPAEAALEGEYSTKSDVYMFAATVWEIYTKGEFPFTKLNDNSVVERLRGGTLDWSVPDSMPEKMAALLKRCWSNSPTDRPQFSEICDEINLILKDITAKKSSDTITDADNV